MRTRRTQRLIARLVLVSFVPTVVACGGEPGEPTATTTTTAALEATTSSAPPTTIPPPPPPSTLPAQPPQQLSKQELRELVAPVALYPDVVLASLLPATTNPDQVHDAAQYVGAAEHVDQIPDDRGWDGSVVGLLQFPDVLRWLDGNPAWTDEMGQAVTYQQADVLQAIQDYRHAASGAGNLKSNQYQVVRAAPNQDIRIEPARPDVVYVPSYDPVAATQPQPVQESPGINPWIAFGGGALVGALGAWALYSIFDDDDETVKNYYGGRRRIRGYQNYYYARGRRPAPVDWTPRPRAYRPRPPGGWAHPRRLEHAAPSTRPAKAVPPLRPPMTRAAGQAPRPEQVRREQRQQRQQDRQLRQEQTRQEQQQQRMQRQQQQAERQEQQRQRREAQRQERRAEQQRQQEQQRQREEQRRTQRQEQQRQQREQQQQQREERQERREQRQGQQQQQRQERQGQQQQQREERQERRGQRQEHQQQQREQRQEQRQQPQVERDDGGGQKPNAKKKKKKAQQ